MNKLVKLGIAGLIGVGIAGCATVPYTRTEVVQYERQPIILKEEKNIVKNIIEEKINDIAINNYNINVFVVETSTNILRHHKATSTETVRREDTITYESKDSILSGDLVGWIPTNKIEGKEEVSARVLEDTKEETEELYSSQPKQGIPVKFSSKNFKFENNLENIIKNTDDNGRVVVSINSYPLLWRATERELTLALGNNLQDQIKDASIRDKVTGSMKIKAASYPIEIETAKKGEIIQNEGNPYYSEVKNDKRTFNAGGYQLDLGELYGYMQNLINGELKERCLSHVYIQARDIESHFPINDALINLKQKKAVPIERLLAEEENIRRRYFVEGSEFFKGTRVDVSPLLIDLSGQKSINSGGLELVSNIGSAYDIEVTHPQYRFLQGEIIFDKKTDAKTIEMISLGSKIRTQETQEKGGKIIDTK